MNRTTVSFLAGVAALALVTGWASTGGSGDAAPRSAQTAAELPVQRSGLLCPAPSTSDLADTTYTSFTPATEGADEKGTARLDPATGLKADDTDAGSGDGDGEKDDKSEDKDSKDKSKGKGKAEDDAFLSAGKPGTPVSENTTSSDAPALTGSANGGLAPGWTVQQTTEVTAGSGRGLQGLSCSPADTEFWFPGASTAADRTDYVHLTNPDDSAAVVDIELHGKEGALEASTGEDITVPPRSSEAILLSTLIGSQETNLTVHVVVRSGRVAAAVQALDDKIGGDWITASADPATSLVVPGIPKDATQVRLVAHAPGDADAELKVRLATPTGLISPADHETLLVKAGMTAAVDLGDITRGEAGSLVLTSADGAPVVAAARVTRGKSGGAQETAFIPATSAVGQRATVAGNSAKGTTLSVVAPEKSARVKVTASAGADGGKAAAGTFTVKAGTTQEIELPQPSGLKGRYALTVETESGGPVYASRTLTATVNGVPAFTVQTLPYDRGTVRVPDTEQDLSILLR